MMAGDDERELPEQHQQKKEEHEEHEHEYPSDYLEPHAPQDSAVTEAEEQAKKDIRASP